jgi:hypothetical protein
MKIRFIKCHSATIRWAYWISVELQIPEIHVLNLKKESELSKKTYDDIEFLKSVFILIFVMLELYFQISVLNRPNWLVLEVEMY